jgi:hypothetical protein
MNEEDFREEKEKMHKYINWGKGNNYEIVTWKEGNTLKFKLVFKYKRVCKI